MPIQILKDLDTKGLIDIPQNYNDPKLNYKTDLNRRKSVINKRKRPNELAVRQLPPPSNSLSSIPLDKLLQNTPLISPEILSNIKALNTDNPNNIKINSLPNFVIEDLYKRGIIQSSDNDPIISKAIENVRAIKPKEGLKNIPDIIKELWIDTPVKSINPNFEIIDQKGNVIATWRDLNRYLNTKLLSKGTLPKLLPQIQNKIDAIPGTDIKMNDLPLSILVEMWKYNDVNVDGTAINTLNGFLSDILKPRKRILQDYKRLMKDIKKRTKQNKGLLLSPRSPEKKKFPEDRSILHPPQFLRNTLSSSRFILPSESASINISKRFGPADIHPSQLKLKEGYLVQRAKINSPKNKNSMLKEGCSTTRFESMYRFYPANSEISAVNASIKGINLNPNSFFRDPSILQVSSSRVMVRSPLKSPPPVLQSPKASRAYR